MRRKRLYIIPQRYKTHDGKRPLSFAIYQGRTFLAYSWSLAGAWVTLQFIRKSSLKHAKMQIGRAL
jgi:hypothetical protein